MNTMLKNKYLSKIQDVLDTKTYPSISKKMKYTDGKDLVVNMIYDQMKANEDWTFNQALSKVEYLLNQNYN